VSIYIPNGTTTEVGGYSVTYRVYNGAGGELRKFQLDQRDNRGNWLRSGTYRVSGALHIQVDNIAGGDHQVAASAVQVSCSS
jgi:hypothetical protein